MDRRGDDERWRSRVQDRSGLIMLPLLLFRLSNGSIALVAAYETEFLVATAPDVLFVATASDLYFVATLT